MGAASFEVATRGFRGDTDTNTGQVATAVAGTQVARIAPAALQVGRFVVDVTVGYGAVAGPADDMELRRGGVAIATLHVLPAVNTTMPVQRFQCVELVGSDDLSVNVIVGGIAGAVYRATILATLFR